MLENEVCVVVKEGMNGGGKNGERKKDGTEQTKTLRR